MFFEKRDTSFPLVFLISPPCAYSLVNIYHKQQCRIYMNFLSFSNHLFFIFASWFIEYYLNNFEKLYNIVQKIKETNLINLNSINSQNYLGTYTFHKFRNLFCRENWNDHKTLKSTFYISNRQRMIAYKYHNIAHMISVFLQRT